MNIEQLIAIIRKELIEIHYSRNEVRTMRLGFIIPAITLPVLIIYTVPILEAALNINIEKDPGHILQYFINRIYPWFFLIGGVSLSLNAITDSIIGEKERKTIERLLSSPVDELTILAGKAIASGLYTYIPTLISFTLFILSANVFASFLINDYHYILPSAKVLFILFAISPILTLTLLGLGILVSVKSKTIKEAINLSGFVSFLLIIPSIYGFMSDPALNILLLISIFGGVLCIMVFLFACSRFKREELIKYT